MVRRGLVGVVEVRAAWPSLKTAGLWPSQDCRASAGTAALCSPAGLHSKLVVRGDTRAAYHNHVMQHCAAEVRALAPDAGLKLETLGELLMPLA